MTQPGLDLSHLDAKASVILSFIFLGACNYPSEKPGFSARYYVIYHPEANRVWSKCSDVPITSICSVPSQPPFPLSPSLVSFGGYTSLLVSVHKGLGVLSPGDEALWPLLEPNQPNPFGLNIMTGSRMDLWPQIVNKSQLRLNAEIGWSICKIALIFPTGLGPGGSMKVGTTSTDSPPGRAVRKGRCDIWSHQLSPAQAVREAFCPCAFH